MLACISGCSGVIGCKVATGGVLRVKKFAQHGLIVGVSVKKFALRARNTPNLMFLRLLGEFCRGLSGGEGVLGELCRACWPATATGPGSATGPVPATDCRPRRQALPLFLMTSSPSGGLHTSCDGGFAPCEALWRRVVGVSEAWMASFPRLVAMSSQLGSVRCPQHRPPR